jgi:hypothetical protein
MSNIKLFETKKVGTHWDEKAKKMVFVRCGCIRAAHGKSLPAEILDAHVPTLLSRLKSPNKGLQPGIAVLLHS